MKNLSFALLIILFVSLTGCATTREECAGNHRPIAKIEVRRG